MERRIFFILALASAFVSCSNEIEYELSGKSASIDGCNSHVISAEKAVEIAGKVFPSTRSGAAYELDYVLNDAVSTRSGNVAGDTLAYILNYDGGNGFVMVSRDDRVFPVLAFSKTGRLEYETSMDDPVYANFISRLPGLYANINADDTVVVVPNDYWATCVVNSPKVVTDWDQWSPFNKYVVQEHPGCPAGCVPVAIGQIMTCCKDFLNFSGIDFYFSSMEEAFKLNRNSQSKSIINPLPNFPKLTYDEALDYAAKLLYMVGTSINTNYTPKGSSAFAPNARNLLIYLGYEVGGFASYSELDVVNKLKEGNLIYMQGTDQLSNEGHAWVVDAYSYCYKDVENPNPEEIENIHIHCNWGWGGEGNGYFSGDVFKVNKFIFTGFDYFTIKKEEFTSVKPYE